MLRIKKTSNQKNIYKEIKILSRSMVIKCAAYGVAIMNGRRGGFINIKDMYNKAVSQGGVRVYEAHESKRKGDGR